APARDARALARRRALCARRRHLDGRVHRAAATDLALAAHARGLARRRIAADLPHRHPAHPRVRGSPWLATLIWPWRNRPARLVVDRLSHRVGPEVGHP